MSESQSFKARCCNPSNRINHTFKSKNLRRISLNLQKKFSKIPPDSKVCGSCRKKAVQNYEFIKRLVLFAILLGHILIPKCVFFKCAETFCVFQFFNLLILKF